MEETLACLILAGQGLFAVYHMAKVNPFEFIQQVRSEVAKVTWPSRRETMITTGMVLVMAFLAAIFFFLADQVLSWGVKLILGLGA